jgi:hypothetical protein
LPRRADADERLRRYQSAIAAGADPEAMVEANCVIILPRPRF